MNIVATPLIGLIDGWKMVIFRKRGSEVADNGAASQVDWAVPPGPAGPIFGTGARPVEKALALVSAGMGTAFVLLYAHVGLDVQWQPWQVLLAAVISWDLIGGVVANGLNSAKRDHFGPPVPRETWLHSMARRPVLFASIHVQPVVISAAFPGGDWAWGFIWYLVTLGTVVLVRRVPIYLQRPVALASCMAVGLGAVVVAAPLGFWWVPIVLVLKLTLAHAVQEEPYRPVVVAR